MDLNRLSTTPLILPDKPSYEMLEKAVIALQVALEQYRLAYKALQGTTLSKADNTYNDTRLLLAQSIMVGEAYDQTQTLHRYRCQFDTLVSTNLYLEQVVTRLQQERDQLNQQRVESERARIAAEQEKNGVGIDLLAMRSDYNHLRTMFETEMKYNFLRAHTALDQVQSSGV